MILGTGTSAMVLEIAAPTLKQLYSVLVDWRVAMNARATNKTDGLVSYTCFLQCKDHPYLVRLSIFSEVSRRSPILTILPSWLATRFSGVRPPSYDCRLSKKPKKDLSTRCFLKGYVIDKGQWKGKWTTIGMSSSIYYSFIARIQPPRIPDRRVPTGFIGILA